VSRRWWLAGLPLWAACGPAHPGPPPVTPVAYDSNGASLLVVATGLRSYDGALLIQVHGSPEGFPGALEWAVRSARVPLRDGLAPEITFEHLPPGEYAVAVFHDENDDGELSTNWIGIPTEGIGASNEAQGSFGPPDYEDARIRVVREQNRAEVRIVYF
jgi:uncharacterized protein (DUF2141 family)